MKRFEVLDSFRGMCAIAVVILHMRYMGSITEISFFRGAGVFVEFFFVLSGFVICHTYGNRKNFKIKSFFISRFFRIYPLHIIMLGLMILFEILKLIVSQKMNFEFSTPPFTNQNSVYEIIPNLLLLQSWTNATNYSSFNYTAWSISVEFYVYFIFIGMVIYFYKARLYVYIVSFIIFLMLINNNITLVNDQAIRGLAGFFGGVLTYQLYIFSQKKEVNFLLCSFCELLALLLVVYIVGEDFSGRRIVGIFSFMLCVFIFSFENGLFSMLFKFKLFKTLGKLSYSIYLIHPSILFLAMSTFIVLDKFTVVSISTTIEGVRYFDFGNGIINSLIVFAVLLVVIMFSSFTYKYIEMKGVNFGRKLNAS